MFKIKIQVLFISFLLISTICINCLPLALADDKNKKDIKEVEVGDPFRLSIDSGEGVVSYSWEITPEDKNHTVTFFIQDKNNEKIHSTNLTNKSDEFLVDADETGTFTFVWQNSNANLSSFYILYNITYPEQIEEVGTGCYSSAIVLTISIMALVFLIFGQLKKKRKSTV